MSAAPVSTAVHLPLTVHIALTVRIALAVLSALLVAVSSPGGPLPLLSWLWLVPIGIAMSGSSARSAAGLALITAWLFWCYSVWWLVPALQQFADVSLPVTLLVFALICLLCALPYGVFGWLYGYFQWYQHRAGVWRAAIAMSVVMSWIPSLIPGHPVHSQFAYPLLIQALDIGGLPVMIFIMTAFQCLLIRLILDLINRASVSKSTVFSLLVLIASVLLYGQFRLQQWDDSDNHTATIRVGVIQPNFHRPDDIAPLFSLSEQLLSRDPSVDLLVWPEFPPAFSIIENPDQREQTLRFSRQHNIPMVVVSGYVYAEPTADGVPRGYYNTSHLIKDGEIQGSYHKRTLVPFFEFLPFEKHFPIVRRWFPDTLRYQPGNSAQPFALDEQTRIIPLICYEVIFPNNIREFVAQGGNLIINPVSDTWFGDSPGSDHHLALALFRSIEYRVPWVRAANSGISVVTQASGRIAPQTFTAKNRQTSFTADIHIPRSASLHTVSLYGLLGNSFLHFLTLLFLLDFAHYTATKIKTNPL